MPLRGDTPTYGATGGTLPLHDYPSMFPEMAAQNVCERTTFCRILFSIFDVTVLYVVLVIRLSFVRNQMY